MSFDVVLKSQVGTIPDLQILRSDSVLDLSLHAYTGATQNPRATLLYYYVIKADTHTTVLCCVVAHKAKGDEAVIAADEDDEDEVSNGLKYALCELQI